MRAAGVVRGATSGEAQGVEPRGLAMGVPVRLGLGLGLRSGSGLGLRLGSGLGDV